MYVHILNKSNILKHFLITYAVLSLISCGGGGGNEDDASNVYLDPLVVTAVAGDSKNTISWNAVPDATSYSVYWNTTGAVTEGDNYIQSMSNRYIHSSVTNDTTYYYKVIPVVTGQTGVLSNEASATPSKPLVGSNWTSRTSSMTNSIFQVTTHNSQFIAVGQAIEHSPGVFVAAILTSDDGATWASSNSGQFGTLYAVASDGTQALVAQQLVYNSADLVTWDSHASAISPQIINKIVWNGNMFVAVGNAGGIMTSTNGATWVARDSGVNTYIADVIWSGEKFVALENIGGLITSVDGITWTRLSSFLFLGGFWDLEWDGNKYIVAGSEGINGVILTSTDGLNWEQQTLGADTGLSGIVWTGQYFIAVGTAGTIMTSSDGYAWTQQTSPASTNLYDIAWNGTQLTIVGQSGTIITSQ